MSDNVVQVKPSLVEATDEVTDQKRALRGKKLGHRRVDQEGQVTYKKIETSQICGSIQQGIENAVGSLASRPERDLLLQDFQRVETTSFHKKGSTRSPPAHRNSAYTFRSYASVAFRYFRDLFGILPEDFLISLVNQPMRELSNPGASGSVFYLTADDNFIIKTVQHKEADFLQKLLPGYYMVRLCVMNNLLPTSVKMHEKYDLKGSTHKRKASSFERQKESPTLKDLDFLENHPNGLFLEEEVYNTLIGIIQRDCRVLESFDIMDYSLLVGVHNLDTAAKEREHRVAPPVVTGEAGARDRVRPASRGAAGGAYEARTRATSISMRAMAAYSMVDSTEASEEDHASEVPVPAGAIPAKNEKGERLLLFVGIIDILQSYRLAKKLEHSWKSILADGNAISVHKPSFYSRRFQDFSTRQVFKKIPLQPSLARRRSTRARVPLNFQSETIKQMKAIYGLPSRRSFDAGAPSISSQTQGRQRSNTITTGLSAPARVTKGAHSKQVISEGKKSDSEQDAERQVLGHGVSGSQATLRRVSVSSNSSSGFCQAL